MARHTVVLPDFAIGNGDTESNVIEDKRAFGAAVDFIIWGPDTLAETVTVHVAPNESPASGDFAALQVTIGTDVIVPQNKAAVIAAAGFKAMKLIAGVTVAGDKTFPFRAQVDMT